MTEEQMQIILEEMNSKFSLMFECFAALDRKIDLRFGELSEQIKLLNCKIDALSQRFDLFEERLGKHIAAVAADLAAHRADTEGHRGVYQFRE